MLNIINFTMYPTKIPSSTGFNKNGYNFFKAVASLNKIFNCLIDFRANSPR